MKIRKGRIFAAGMLMTLIISGSGAVVRTGRELEHIRSKVLRLHILAESDSPEDQARKTAVRDALLESGIFEGAEDLSQAEELAKAQLGHIKAIAEETLRENGSAATVQAYLTNMDFSPRTYGGITMPAGNYRTLRVEIGTAQGHNWWCVMYPPLCIPQASEVTADTGAEKDFFTDEEQDILNRPDRYEVRLALWDMVSGLSHGNDEHIPAKLTRKLVHNAEKQLST